MSAAYSSAPHSLWEPPSLGRKAPGTLRRACGRRRPLVAGRRRRCARTRGPLVAYGPLAQGFLVCVHSPRVLAGFFLGGNELHDVPGLRAVELELNDYLHAVRDGPWLRGRRLGSCGVSSCVPWLDSDRRAYVDSISVRNKNRNKRRGFLFARRHSVRSCAWQRKNVKRNGGANSRRS